MKYTVDMRLHLIERLLQIVIEITARASDASIRTV